MSLNRAAIARKGAEVRRAGDKRAGNGPWSKVRRIADKGIAGVELGRGRSSPDVISSARGCRDIVGNNRAHERDRSSTASSIEVKSTTTRCCHVIGDRAVAEGHAVS